MEMTFLNPRVQCFSFLEPLPGFIIVWLLVLVDTRGQCVAMMDLRQCGMKARN